MIDTAIRVRNRLWRLSLRIVTFKDSRSIERSGLFDENFYEICQQNTPELPPLIHFHVEGARLGLRPNLYFDPLWYRRAYLNISTCANPLNHYIRRGEAMGLQPTPSFDPLWYGRRYDLAKGLSPLAHFLAHRRTQRFSPNAAFDIDFYLARHGEEIGPNRDPYAHFLRHGAARNLDPSADFDSALYRAQVMAENVPPARPDVSPWSAQEDRIPLVHHLRRLAEASAADRLADRHRLGAPHEAITHAL